jgi:pimeloyl-ACP methyl ester carboxylesterase
MPPHTFILDGIWGRPRRWRKLAHLIEQRIGPAHLVRYDASGRSGLDALGLHLLNLIDQRAPNAPIHLVAHSMGCLVARSAHMQQPALNIRRAAMLNGPHDGSILAHLLPLRACRDMRPGSDFLLRLRQAEQHWHAPTLVTWCRGDLLILPNRSMRWRRATTTLRYKIPAHNWPCWSHTIRRRVVDFLADQP